MARGKHYVIIGNGVAGNEAAIVIREKEPESRITMISAGRLLFYNRYELPRLFFEDCDWRDFLVNPPAYYEDNQITVRRNNFVTNIDPTRKVLILAHKEEVSYDQLLVASGGGAYLPEDIVEYTHLLDRFHNYRDASRFKEKLPPGGKAVMLGGDVLGLDLARNLIKAKYEVTVVAAEQTFWPHVVDDADKPKFFDALRTMGMEVIEGKRVSRIEEGAKGMSARRLLFADGEEMFCDVVMAFFGLAPAADFMMGTGVDIERGILVNPNLQTTDPHIYAAGDVCQIWSKEENSYRFYYGWRNVKRMGEIAARNMTGDDVAIDTVGDEVLGIDKKGHIHTPHWEYE